MGATWVKRAGEPPLSVWGLVAINVIAIDNLRTLPFSAGFGVSLVTVYGLALLAFLLPVAMTATELATGWPDRGGVYVWVKTAFGPVWGLWVVWLQWVYNVVWYPTILTFVVATLATWLDPGWLHHPFHVLLSIWGLFGLATLSNVFGMRTSSVVSVLGALVGTLLPMALIMALGAWWLWQGHPSATPLTMVQWWPRWHDPHAVTFLLAVVFGLVGIEMSAIHADDVADPGRAYPRAMLLSLVIIFVTLVGASLAVAVVVPHQKLNVITGLMQAFAAFFDAFHWHHCMGVVACLIGVGALCGVSAWVIGPTKALQMAVVDSNGPGWMGRCNRHGAPVGLLLIQALCFMALSGAYVTFPSLQHAYEWLTVLTTQLSLCVYLAMFAAAWWLRRHRPEVQRAYRVPGGRWGFRLCIGLGAGFCLLAFGLGFWTADGPGITATHTWVLLGSLCVLALPGLALVRQTSPR